MTETILSRDEHPSVEVSSATALSDYVLADTGNSSIITPDSLLFRLVGDQRYAFPGFAAGNLQLMHPAIGAAVIEHSDFFDDPWDRVFRSLPKIIGSVCSPDAQATGEWVRKRHNKIEGADDGHGNSYHALDPEVFWWAHATFTRAAEDVADRFTDQPLDRAQREQLYRESVEWYRRYGLDMAPVPCDYKAFLEKWHYICGNVLEMTPAATRSVDIARRRDIPRPPNITPKQWKLLRVPASAAISLSAIGCLPKELRQRLDIPFSRADRAQLRGIELFARKGFRFLPKEMRYYPEALRGMAAAEAL